MRKILIPADFSDNALNAIKYATELFKHGPCEIFILHVIPPLAEIGDKSMGENAQNAASLKAEEDCKALEKQVLEHSPNPKHSIKSIIDTGLLVDTVNDWVDKENIDVVVMGTKGQTADKKLTFGSNTLQVIKYVKCPVLAIPSVYKDVHPKNILFPTDFLLPYKRRELKMLATISKNFASRIHFLHVSKFSTISSRQENNKKFLEMALTENRINFIKREDTDITTAINSHIKENPTDMLVLVNTRHSYLENILYQSTIEKIGLHIDIPFLVMQNLPR